MRHVRLGNELHRGRDLVERRPHELDRRMRLREVNARGAGLLPKERDRIESDVARAALDVKEQRLEHAQHHARVREIDVHLVRAERRPHAPHPAAV